MAQACRWGRPDDQSGGGIGGVGLSGGRVSGGIDGKESGSHHVETQHSSTGRGRRRVVRRRGDLAWASQLELTQRKYPYIHQ